MDKLMYPRLFEPLKLGNQVFKNRILASPQDYPGLTAERFLTEEAVYFYERKAQGGFAAVTVGDLMVDPDFGRSHDFQMRGLDTRGKVNLARVATGIKRHGAIACAELNSAGANADVNIFPEESQPFVYGPSAFQRHDGVEVREANDEQIEGLIKRYVDAASWAVQTGFNSIMLHAGHGWELHQYISPTTNHRTDQWGGSTEKRMRILIAIVEGIRNAVGKGIPIEVRMSIAEYLKNGYDSDEGVAMAKLLDGKVDMINVSCGHHEDPVASMYSSPTMFHEDGHILNLAWEVKRSLEYTKVSAVGGFSDPEMMEEALAQEKCDFFHLGRQSLADPDFARKARKGAPEQIRPCLRCFNCFNNSTINGVFYCAVCPEVGRETVSMLVDQQARYKKKVVVVGGGPAGMQAALTAADQGHAVVLAEKSSQLGGCLLCEENVPFKQNLQKYLRRQAAACKRHSGIELHLNCEATPEWVSSHEPDAVIAALGSRARRIWLPGIDKALCADDAYLHPENVGDTVAIIGGGLTGLELGIYLSSLGKKVTVTARSAGTCATPVADDRSAESTSSRMSGLMGLPAGYPLVQGGAIAVARLKYPDYEIKSNTSTL